MVCGTRRHRQGMPLPYPTRAGLIVLQAPDAYHNHLFS